jgi:hypothetical protein
MAKYQNGILGSFSGKVGNVVGSSWNGIPVIRSKPSRKQGGNSLLQEQQRAKFLLMTKFLRPLTELFNQTYRRSAVGMTCFNKAFSENRNALTGDYPTLGIDYPRILLSKGKLPLGEPPALSSPGKGKLLLTWKTGDGINRELTKGAAFIAAYNETFSRWIFELFETVDRSSSCILDADLFAGMEVQTWVGFIARGGGMISESRYMGVIRVSG